VDGNHDGRAREKARAIVRRPQWRPPALWPPVLNGKSTSARHAALFVFCHFWRSLKGRSESRSIGDFSLYDCILVSAKQRRHSLPPFGPPGKQLLPCKNLSFAHTKDNPVERYANKLLSNTTSRSNNNNNNNNNKQSNRSNYNNNRPTPNPQI